MLRVRAFVGGGEGENDSFEEFECKYCLLYAYVVEGGENEKISQPGYTFNSVFTARVDRRPIGTSKFTGRI